MDAYDRWADAHPEVAARLPTVRTARGYHVYGRLDAEVFRALDDGELRSDARHYVLLPPSIHPDGITYTWTVPLPDGDLLALPLSLAQGETQAHSAPTHTLHVSDSGLIQSAILSTLPTGPGQRNRRLFDLARRLKSVAPRTSVPALEEIVRDWHGRALAAIGTKDWLTTWLEFRVAWARVKRPIGRHWPRLQPRLHRPARENADAIPIG